MIDLITNSSSELFVFQNDNRDIVLNMIVNIWPNFTKTNNKLLGINELDDILLMNYTYIMYGQCTKDAMIKVPGFNNKDFYGEVDPYDPNHQKLLIKKEVFEDSNRKKLLAALDPFSNKYFLYDQSYNMPDNVIENLQKIAITYEQCG